MCSSFSLAGFALILSMLNALALSTPFGFLARRKDLKAFQSDKLLSRRTVEARNAPADMVISLPQFTLNPTTLTASIISLPPFTLDPSALTSIIPLPAFTTLAPTATAIPIPAFTSTSLLAAPFEIAYHADNYNMTACTPSADPTMCTLNYHTNEKWYAGSDHYGVLLLFDNNCREMAGNWYVLSDDLKKGFVFDAGLPETTLVTVNMDTMQATLKYGVDTYGPEIYSSSAAHTQFTGPQTQGRYDIWQMLFKCRT